ncbi:G-protein coupled receptor 55 isoform X2 [Polypterus senegalus]|nr:G-protein coupled receptor 55 isoform X2 [Polypterus senegalus]XP_039611451.1 G-protein coupled receptor 55 isoform X2 [Polypterus senegalus]XP_039611459.1 G-protein coupled receptor 55 isoform X2 [Polypterus senegalus]
MDCDMEVVKEWVNTIQLIIYIPTFIVGVFLNSIALFIFIFKMRTESTIYMTNLAIMDIFLLIPLPFRMYAAKNRWILSKSSCSVFEALYFVGVYGSILTITFISIDRYFSIKHPFKAKVLRSPRNVCIACIGIWIMLLVGVLPVFTFHTNTNTTEDFRCFHNFSDDSWQPKVVIPLEVFGFLIPVSILLFCSIRIINALKKLQSNDKTSLRIVYANLFVFLISFTPSHLGIFLQFLVRNKILIDCSTKMGISFYVQISMCFSNITCCLDAICYYFVASEFRSRGIPRRLSSRNPNTSVTEI